MISLSSDLIRTIGNLLPVYDYINLGYVCKKLRDDVKNDPRWTKSSSTYAAPRHARSQTNILKIIFEIYPAYACSKAPFNPEPTDHLPPGFTKVQRCGSFHLAFYKDHLKLYEKLNHEWIYLSQIKAPQYNHVLIGGSYILNYDDFRIVLKNITRMQTQLFEKDPKTSVRISSNAFTYTYKAKTCVVWIKKNIEMQLDLINVRLLHETGIFLHLITPTSIVHLNMETKEKVVEETSIPPVLWAKDDILVCDGSIVQLSHPKSITLCKF